MLRPLLLIVAATGATQAFGQAPVPDPARAAPAAAPVSAAPAGDARTGHSLFVQYGCHECHGTTGQGGGIFGPRIAPKPIPYLLYYNQVRRPRMMMSVYSKKILSDQQVADIYAYLVSIPATKSYRDIPALNIK